MSEEYGYTGFSSQIETKLRDWAVGQAGGSCDSWAALSSNDSKTLYKVTMVFVHPAWVDFYLGSSQAGWPPL